MPRFFVEQAVLQDRFVVLTGDAAAHAKVLRLKNGDKLTLCTGDGMEHSCTVSDCSPGQISLVVESVQPSRSEPKLQCSVFMALSKGDKLEHVIQKATELGAVKIYAFPSARCVSRPEDHALQKKLERWQKIAAGAAEQSGRGVIPQVAICPTWTAALQEAAKAELSVLLYENEQRLSFRTAVGSGSFSTAAIVTGPEGGFTPEEIEDAKAAGLQICTLGPRILRCETAPLCALSAILFAAGEFDEKEG